MITHSLKKMTALILAVSSVGTLLSQDDSVTNKLGTTVQMIVFTPNGSLKIIPSASSSKNDFDFLIGLHYVHHKKLKSRLNKCTEWEEFEGTHEMRAILNGMGNIESHHMIISDSSIIEGTALRLFNPKTRLWSIYWASSTTGSLEPPVVGSFDKNIGIFYGKDIFKGKPILVMFKWDKTDPDKPVWSQAFSVDKGKTWEWNWYMRMERSGEAQAPAMALNKNIKVIELRNYVIKDGMREKFVEYFNSHFVSPQIELGGYILGQYKPRGEEDNFFWVRGFADMAARSKFLPDFYRGPVWKKYREEANAMLANNDNVYLLKPLLINNGGAIDTTSGISSDVFNTQKGIMVIDFYIANHKLGQLIELFAKKYVPILINTRANNTSFWISELRENDFPILPVFQDKDLLVAFSFYKDESEYQNKMKDLEAAIPPVLKNEMRDVITTKNTLILYPAKQ